MIEFVFKGVHTSGVPTIMSLAFVVWLFYLSLSFKILASCTYAPFHEVNPMLKIPFTVSTAR